MERRKPLPSFLNKLLFSLVCRLFVFWLDYHCAFKKRGTMRLAWLLVAIPLSQCIGLASSLWMAEFLGWGLFEWIACALCLNLEFYYWLNCYRLRRVNLKRREVDFSSLLKRSTELSELVFKIEQSQTLESLRVAFGSTLRRLPHWEKQLTRKYRKKKACLLETSSV